MLATVSDHGPVAVVFALHPGQRGHPGQLERVRYIHRELLILLAHGGPLLEVVSWRTPNSYREAGVRRATATSKLDKIRDNLRARRVPDMGPYLRA